MIFWILFLLLILLGIWFCIEQHVLRVRKQTLSLEHLPAGWDGVSLLQITDLHHRQMGRGNCRIIRQAKQLQPDVIVLTGDMISRDMRDFHEISSFLQALSKISPTYLCTGNHELDLPPEVQQEFWAMRSRQAVTRCEMKRFRWKSPAVLRCIWREPNWRMGSIGTTTADSGTCSPIRRTT